MTSFLYTKTKRSDKRIYNIICISVIVIYVLLLYRRYIFGDKLFIFTDIAFDSASQTYPNLLFQARRVSDGLWGELINFSQGIGNYETPFIPGFGNWFCLLGEDRVSYLLGLTQATKVALVGIIAYFWAKKFDASLPFCVMIAVGCMSCPDITIRSAWYSYPNTVLLFVFWMYAFEITFREKKLYLLPIATMTLFYSVGVYYCFVWGIFLALYIVFRFFSNSSDIKGIINKTELRRCFLLYAIFWALGSLDVIVNDLVNVFSTSRFQNGVSGFSLTFEDFIPEMNVVVTSFLRTVGQTINGVYTDYCGNINFLEDPAFYCGIFLFLMLPVAYININKVKKVWFGIFIILGLIYLLFRPIRTISNGFNQTDTFKTSSFWLVIIEFLLVLDFFSAMNKDKVNKVKSIAVFWIFDILVVAALNFCCRTRFVVNRRLCYFSILFCVFYGVIFTCYLFCRKVNYIGIAVSIIICCCFILETYQNNYRTVVARDTFYKSYLNDSYYNDGTIEAVDTIGNRVNDDFYRIEKSYYSIGNCDSLAQHYYGTESYIGVMEADPSVQDLYKIFGLPTQMGMHHLLGSGGNLYIGSLLGVKYYLTRSESINRYGYESFESSNDIYIERNNNALPLLFTYDNVMTESSFDALNSYDRSRNILKACTINQNIEDEYDSILFDYNDINDNAIEFLEVGGRYIIDSLDRDTLVIVLNMDKDGNSQSIHYVTKDGMDEYEVINYEKGQNIIELTCKGLKEVYFSDDMNTHISEIRFFSIESNLFYSEYLKDIKNLNDNAPTIVEHDDIYNNIKGEIKCSSNCVLSSSIPYNIDWKIEVDGEEVEVLKTNKAFIGCFLTEGEHELLVYYDGSKWIISNCFKVFGFTFSALLSIYFWVTQKSGGDIFEGK